MCAGIYSKRRFFFIRIFFYILFRFGRLVRLLLRKNGENVYYVCCLWANIRVCVWRIFLATPQPFHLVHFLILLMPWSNYIYERRTLSYMISFIFPFFRLFLSLFSTLFLPFIYLFFTLLLLLLCSLNESRYHLFFLHFIMHTLVISTVSISINRLDCINKPKFTIRK